MRLPPLKSLHVFLIAAERESFKAAAEHLFVTQAAVSQQIRLLENYFDCPLFERDKKSTRLNAKGLLLMPFIARAFKEIKDGVATVNVEPNNNELKITALHSVTSLLLLPRIDAFQQANPDLNIQFSPNNNLNSFDEHDIDLAVRRGQGNYAGLESRQLCHDNLVLVACPRILAGIEQDVEKIFSLPLLEDTSSDIQAAISDCCHHYHIKREQLVSMIKTTDAVPIIQNALAGRGLAFVSKVLVNEHLRSGNLVNVLNYHYDDPRTLYLVAPSHHFKWEKVRRFEQWLIDVLQQ
ncbi:LysR substrate-binding domain-containing protein [Colwelliaceae bacterium 6471]